MADASLSMEHRDLKNAQGRSRLDAVREAGKLCAKKLFLRARTESLRARCCVISFAGSARVVCPLTESIEEINRALDGITLESYTNLHDPLHTARSASTPTAHRFGILVTDGNYTVGAWPGDIADELKGDGFTLEVFGIGSQYLEPGELLSEFNYTTSIDGRLLEAMASLDPNTGDRLYHFIDDFERLKEMYGQSAGRIINTVARLREV